MVGTRRRKAPRATNDGELAVAAADRPASPLPPPAGGAPPLPPRSAGDASATDDGPNDPADVVVDVDGDDEFVFPDATGLVEERVVRVGVLRPLDDESDTSDEVGPQNRVGDIPLEWYDGADHVGYDVEGHQLKRSEKSALGRLLDVTDNPDAYRTIYDALHDEHKVLTDEELQVILNLQSNRTLNGAYDMYRDTPSTLPPFDPLNHPLARSTGPSKSTFVPARRDMRVIEKMVRRMRSRTGEFAPKPPEKDPSEPFLLWDTPLSNVGAFRKKHHIDKPKAPPPGTYESYRPPAEYLPSERARERQQRLRRIDRKEHFLPIMFDCLRHVPWYDHTLQDRYQRCLDLVAFPRRTRTRLHVDPAKLLPELPDPADLRPYPERLSFVYRGHTATVRSVSVTPSGQYIATACDDHLVRLYDVLTGRLMKRYDLGGAIQQVAFAPNDAVNILAVACDYAVLLLVPPFTASDQVVEHTIRTLRAAGATDGSVQQVTHGTSASLAITQTARDADEVAFEGAPALDPTERDKRAEFVDATPTERAAGIVVKATLHARVKRVAFHQRGDYLCALCPKDHVKYRQVVMLQLSRRKVFCPFRKFSEIVTDCAFDRSEPHFYLATTNTVRCYNLMANRLQKRYVCTGGVTTCLSLHASGEHFVVGDTTSHCSWFDTNFSDKPYKRMKSHRNVVSAVALHPRPAMYPLLASASSDGQVHVFHAMAYEDYNKNALIVPVKILKHQRPVYAVAWHPTLPWLFTTEDDGTVSCWTE